MYVNYSFYVNTYGGTIIPSKKDFLSIEREAENYIRYLTYINGDIFADLAQMEVIKCTVCAAAEAYYTANNEQKEGGNLKSESKDGLSVSFLVSRKDGETMDQYVKRCMYQVIYTRLLPTGWLCRKVEMRCKHDHKCNSDYYL